MSSTAYKMSRGEEVANAVTHGIAAALTLSSIPYAAIRGYVSYGQAGAISISVFTICIFLMFTSSALYHSMSPETAHKRVFHILDHIFIYFAIAGSYTPLAVLLLKGSFGIGVLVLQWVLVLVGSAYKLLRRQDVGKWNLAFYLLMGWTALALLPMLLRQAGADLLGFIIAGGIFYTVGAAFYALKGFRYHHLVWHLMIMMGALSHFIAIVLKM